MQTQPQVQQNAVVQQQNSPVQSRPNAARILSVDHKTGLAGKYFNFAISEMDAVLGTSDWSVKVGTLHSREHGPVEVKLWRNANGGSSGSGHGRLNSIPAVVAGYWKVGDGLLDVAQVPFTLTPAVASTPVNVRGVMALRRHCMGTNPKGLECPSDLRC